MRKAKVLFRTEDAGMLTQFDNGSFAFDYNSTWLADSSKPPICIGMPKSKQSYRSQYLFPNFYNMLPEGYNKSAVCKSLRIDDNDYFGLMLAVAKHDTIGAVTVQPI
ncbi:MAG TPA: phosphatidylinositol kinase [Bacteroidales bacterium]|nr:phosphatidylinositol kinase [Bacteroidales bacterium]